MCDIDQGEQCDVWVPVERKARASYHCAACRFNIVAGERYLRIGYMYEGSWGSMRVHISCKNLVEYIAFDVCGQEAYYFDGDLRENVREHMHEDPMVLLLYRDHLRQRNRAEREAA